MARPLHVLVVADHDEEAQHILRALRQDGFEPDAEIVTTRAAAEAALAQKTWDVVIHDHGVPGCPASEAIATVCARRDAEERWRDAEQRYRSLVEQIPAVTYIATADATRATIYVSPQITALTGFAPAQWIDRSDRWIARIHHEDRPRVLKELLRCTGSGSAFNAEYRLVGRDGRAIWVRDVAAVVQEKPDDPHYLRGFVVDVTRERESEETIHRMAYRDRLTDLPNETLLLDRVRESIEDGRRFTRSFGLLLICVQGMTDINNTLGRAAGDALLCQIANRLRQRTRTGATVARVAGHEFAVIVTGANADRAMQFAQQVVADFEAPFEVEGISLSVRVDVGVAVFPGHGQEAELLLRRADVAASSAQRSGSGCEMFCAEQDPYSSDRLALIGELRHAIDAGQLVLHFQPIIDLKTRTISGVESLVRWHHPRRGLLQPDEFIGAAESTGLIQPLAAWVLDEAVRRCWTWQHESVPLTVAANLSARNLQDARLPDRVAGLINTWGLDPSRLVLELTESTVMADPPRAIEVLHQLRKMGVRLSIDDFGTGYSSLGYLRNLPVTDVKLDKSLVTGIATNGIEGLIVQSVADLAHHLDLKVIAEGVEDAKTLDLLIAAGCDAAQGFYMARPMDLAVLTRWLEESPFGLGGAKGPRGPKMPRDAVGVSVGAGETAKPVG